jgi:hypothetical protein
MNGFSAGVDEMKAWVKGLSESAETLLQADEALTNFLVGVGTPATNTGTPCSEASNAPPTTF